MGVKVKNKTLLITIDNEISSWWGISHKEISDGIEEASGSFTSVQMKVNSPGGSVTDGMAIRGEILNLVDEGFAVDVEIMGVAASIASVIALSGTSLKMRVGSYLMIHEPTTVARGTWKVLQNLAKTIKKMWGDLIDIYEENSNIVRAELEQMVADETWITAKEAVGFGFASAITVSKRGEVLNKGMEVFADSIMMESFHHIPENLLMNKKIDDKPDSTEEIPMNLIDATKAHPEIQAELTAAANAAKGEGAKAEGTRLISLLALTGGIMTPGVITAINDGSTEAQFALTLKKAELAATTTPEAQAIAAAAEATKLAAATTPEAIAAAAALAGGAPLYNMSTIPPITPISDLKLDADVADKADDAAFEAMFADLDLELDDEGDE